MTELTHEAVQDALRIADEVSPAPARAAAALQILKKEVLHRWEQRTALSFRLQDLRNQLQAIGLPDDSPLYLALHATTATAEAWMHPDTLSDAARDHLSWIKAELAHCYRLISKAPVSLAWPARGVQLTITCPRIGDELMFPRVSEALNHFAAQNLKDWGAAGSHVIHQGLEHEVRIEVSIIPDAGEVATATREVAKHG